MTREPLLPEVADLLEQLCRGELRQEQARRLEDLLLDHPEQCRHYVRFLHMHALVEHSEWPHLAGHAIIGLNQAAPDLSPPVPVVSLASPRGSVSRTVTVLCRPVFWTTLAVGAVLYGAFALLSWDLRGGAMPGDPMDAGFVAIVGQTSDVHWSANTEQKASSAAVQAGEMLAIDSGTVELQLKQGTTLTIEGPAQWSIDADNHATLNWGKLMARVPKAAIGFVLETPAARVVDLGTEFAVRVERGGDVDVHVFQGRVTVQASQAEDPAPFSLQAGKAVRVAASSPFNRKIQQIALDRAPFQFLQDKQEVGQEGAAGEVAGVRSRPYRIYVDNPSFEEPRMPDGKHQFGIPGWQGMGGVHAFHHQFTASFPEGRQMAYLNGKEAWQTLRERLASNTRYELSLFVGRRRVVWNNAADFLKLDYCVELCAGEVVLASSTNGVLPEAGKIEPLTLSFEAGADPPGLGQPLTIRLRSLGTLEANTQNHFDQVQLIATPIP